MARMTTASKRPGTDAPRGSGRDRTLWPGRCPLPLGRISDGLTRPPSGQGSQLVQRCGGAPCSCESERYPHSAVPRDRARPSGPVDGAVPQSVSDTLRTPGRELESAVRGEMTSRFGRDFSSVRIHTDAEANRSATDVGARAYAAGSHVVFGVNEYQPSTLAGQRLLAHELAHVIQQEPTISAGHLVLGSPHAPAEAEAGRMADVATGKVLTGRNLTHQVDPLVVQRQPRTPDAAQAQAPQNVPLSPVRADANSASGASQHVSATVPIAAALLPPPGDCTWAQHRILQNEVDRACDRDTRCTQNDSCPVLWEKIGFSAECIRARAVINAQCFRGGNPGHVIALANAVAGLARCWDAYIRECQRKPVPVPEPKKTPEPVKKPVIDKTFMERMAAITGLTGTALVVYLIISEGTRLFPPRNLIPAP